MRPYLDVVKEAADLHSQGKLDQAAFLYEHLLGNQPDDAAVLYLLGTLCSQQARFGSAITLLRAAVERAPDLDEAWHNLGVAYRNEGHTADARKAYGRAISLNPGNADLMAMMSGSYVNSGEPEEAVKWADKALAIDPESPHAKNHKALALLEMGKFAEAWPHYEARFGLKNHCASPRPYECPRWDGKPVKKLAIHGEQGLGDEIMFLSCFADAKKLAETVVIECAGRIKTLIERSLGVECFASHDELIKKHPDVDAYVPMGSLPALFRNKREDFPGTPFLKANEAKVWELRARMEKLGPGPYVGIAWHGGTKGTHQYLRNAPQNLWEALCKGPGTYVSLQYGDEAAPQAKEIGCHHWPEVIEDIDDSAALVAACDLVISVCQTAIHVAGGLGVRCWCLTPSQPAWRYGIKGSMPWYKSVDLVRQHGDDWGSVFMDVGQRLVKFANKRATKAA